MKNKQTKAKKTTTTVTGLLSKQVHFRSALRVYVAVCMRKQSNW